jgi:hypothetical protein
MNRSEVADLEGATDQLVDEICQRLTALYALVDTSLDDAGPAVEDIRERAVHVVRRLSSSQSQSVARSISGTLWPRPPGLPIPPPWRGTPLGELITASLDRAELKPGTPASVALVGV